MIKIAYQIFEQTHLHAVSKVRGSTETVCDGLFQRSKNEMKVPEMSPLGLIEISILVQWGIIII